MAPKGSGPQKPSFSQPPYLLSADQVAQELGTNLETGLSPPQAKQSLDQYGENKLEGGEGVPVWKVFIKQISNAMVLIIAMALSYGVKDWIEGGVITAVIFLNVTIGFFQEYRAEKTMDSLRSLSSPTAAVLRDGNLDHIASIIVVPGDIVELKTGDVVPADLRLFEAMNFETDEALLTGESLPVFKEPEPPIEGEVGVGDRTNMAFSSSTKLAKLAYCLLLCAVVLAIIVFAANKFRIPHEVVIYAISLGIAIIPESLIAVLTITMAVGMKTMVKRKVIVRKLDALEALGGVSNICSDKTGTLTQGRMITRKAWVPGVGIYTVDRTEEAANPTSGDFEDGSLPEMVPELAAFLHSSALCNLATVRFDNTKKRWQATGDPTETAGRHFRNTRSTATLRECPLYSRNPTTGDTLSSQKGLLRELLTFAQTQMTILADQGLRVLAIARRTIDRPRVDWNEFPRDEVEQSLTLMGLAGLYDPPRLETKDAVRKCTNAGIQVHMLTGDHPSTARVIAREVDQLPALPFVIARCAPNTKVRMIDALHRRGRYAAMTGDGVNDSPSLKRADVGIAMGLAGSDVAKSASDIVLTDDNFESIVNAVEEGRRMFDNIQKFILHLLVSNVGEVMLLIIGLAFRDRDNFSVFPLAPLEILWINMLTSSFPAFGLGLEKATSDIMRRPPHDTKVGVFTKQILVDMVVYGTIMGACSLCTFVIIIYGVGNGNLGVNCNSKYSSECDLVFRARAAVFAQLTWLILISAWEFKSIRRSMFRFDPYQTEHRFPFFRDAISVFPIVYIPGLNTGVFKHKGITWEWALSFGAVPVFVCGVEAWKFIKRKYGLFNNRQSDRVKKDASLSLRQGFFTVAKTMTRTSSAGISRSTTMEKRSVVKGDEVV
ncbi:potassium/sodium eff [Tuber magnatum]|uniref:Potassium/sodium eff n=1 Tax=Tuber magnatum TaxID=42249 RepID=A0A317SWZ7_9PEZI|nr:potassium/sodium eff [Tuber magnatum]